MAPRRPSPELKAFGVEVIRLREQAGLTRTDLAARVSVTRSYIGQVESGVTRCRKDFAARLDKALDTGSTLEDGWDDLLRSTGYPKWFDFPKAEMSAVLLRSYQAFVVDGLLQIESYARALLHTDDAVAGRLRRQNILTRPDPPLLVVMLDESVLLRQVGTREVMRDQLEHLIEVSNRDNVILQIAPTAYYRGVHGSFTIATQPSGDAVVHLANTTGGHTSNEPDEIMHVTKAFATLQAHALSVDDSRDLIRKVVQERWT